MSKESLGVGVSTNKDYDSNPIWGWIAGAVVLVLMLVFLFGGKSRNSESKENLRSFHVVSPSAECKVEQSDTSFRVDCPKGVILKVQTILKEP